MHPYYKWVKGFILSPKKAFENEKKTDFFQMLRKMIPLFVFYSILTGIVSAFALSAFVNAFASSTLASSFSLSSFLPEAFSPTPRLVISLIVNNFVAAIVITMLVGVWLHFWLYLVGARKGIEKTIMVTFYSSIPPTFLFGWIPLLGFTFIGTGLLFAGLITAIGFGVLLIWELYLLVIGIKMYQKMKGGKVGLGILLSFILPVVVIVMAVVFLLGVLSAFAVI